MWGGENRVSTTHDVGPVVQPLWRAAATGRRVSVIDWLGVVRDG